MTSSSYHLEIAERSTFERGHMTATRIKASSVGAMARIVGVLYLLNIIIGIAAALFDARGLTAYSSTANLTATVCYALLTIILYRIFAPVSEAVSLLAAAFSLAGCAVSAWDVLASSRFPVSALAFFGCYCVLLGYLVVRSTFLPRLIGFLLVFAGLAWMTFLWPQLARQLSPYIMAPGLVGEGAFTVWLLAKGVDEASWKRQAFPENDGPRG